MRRIVHLSDLHFGSLDRRTLEPLRRAVLRNRPHLVLVSGDLTQRARPDQFREARDFLATLGAPCLSTPGNHDVPLWNLLDRFLRPLERYREHFASDPEPVHVDEELVVVGVNTARSNVVKSGRINPEQIERIRSRFAPLPDDRTKIVFTHHPIAESLALGPGDRAGRSDRALAALAPVGVDLLLAGHLHRADASAAPVGSGRAAGWGVVGVSAGTATSSRRRDEENGFNVLEMERPALRFRRWHFDGEQFTPSPSEQRFVCDERGWRQVGGAGEPEEGSP